MAWAWAMDSWVGSGTGGLRRGKRLVERSETLAGSRKISDLLLHPFWILAMRSGCKRLVSRIQTMHCGLQLLQQLIVPLLLRRKIDQPSHLLTMREGVDRRVAYHLILIRDQRLIVHIGLPAQHRNVAIHKFAQRGHSRSHGLR